MRAPHRNVPRMVLRTWARTVSTALGLGVLAGAGQLGVAYGLGIVRFSRVFDISTRNEWTAQLAWIAWFAVVAAVVAAVAADRLTRRRGHRGDPGIRVALAVAAGLGAGAVAPLSMQPARAAVVPSVNPVLVVGMAAVVGAVVGMFAAVAALSHRAARWNVASVTGVVWLLALVSARSLASSLKSTAFKRCVRWWKARMTSSSKPLGCS